MSTIMQLFKQRYGANPLHLLAFLASFGLAGYAATGLFQHNTIRVAVWFVGAAIGHDAILVPLYGVANLSHTRIWRAAPEIKSVPWLNYVRFPAVISLILLLIYFPEISHRHTAQYANSGIATRQYFPHWLLITGILFGVSAISYSVSMRRAHLSAARANS